MKTVAIIEGFAGGPMHTRKFRKALSRAGFKVIKNRRQADIIIAHSAGIYAVPPTSRAVLLVLINPTYWPGKPLLRRMGEHRRTNKNYLVSEFGWRHYMREKALELYYFFRRHIYAWHGIFNNNRLNHIQRLIHEPERKVLIVRNLDDPFSSPEIKSKLMGKNVQFVELPGIHSDYYTNPQPYIDLISKAL